MADVFVFKTLDGMVYIIYIYIYIYI